MVQRRTGVGMAAIAASFLIVSGSPARGVSICDRQDERLVAWWRLDDGGRRVVAEKTGKHDGEAAGKLAAASGIVDGGLSFDGETGEVVVKDAADLDLGACRSGAGLAEGASPGKGAAAGKGEEPAEPGCGFTIETWVYTRAAFGFRPMVDKRGGEGAKSGYSLYLAHGDLAFSLGDGRGLKSYVSKSFVADGRWHHVAVTVDRSERGAGVLYVDGRAALGFEALAGSLDNTASLLIGGAAKPYPEIPPAPSGPGISAPIKPPSLIGSEGHFRGVLDDVALYARALSAKEIAVRFGDGLPWKCGERGGERGAYDVGVVPEHAGVCPPGSEYVSIYMDDEDDDNASAMSGWVGAMSQVVGDHVHGTRLGFCRVDGSQFHNLGHSNLINWQNVAYSSANAPVGAYTYSLLKLGSQCPNGSIEANVHIDNEDDDNENSWSGNIAPNIAFRNADLVFCMFTPSSGSSMMAFPDLGIAYGVLGGLTSPPALGGHHNFWLQTGTVYTDDEDDWNWGMGNEDNVTIPTADTQDDFSDFDSCLVNANHNTHFYLAKVRNAPCPNPCPTGGHFDGANCFLYAVPGNIPFVWDGSFYYGKVQDHPGSPCPHEVHDMLNGSSITPGFDTANCHIASANGGPNPFLWDDNYYISRSCTGCADPCPFGGTFDTQNCYMFTWPGVRPFVWANNGYYEPVWHPDGVCPHRAYNLAIPNGITPGYDSVNCMVFAGPGNGQQAFLWDNKYYLTRACTP